MRAWIAPIVLAAAVQASALAVVYSKHESRRLFVALQALETQRDDMNIEWGRLQLEQSTWATHGRIAGTANERLNMVVPDMDTITIVTTTNE
ncbi:MAG: cell division protein FtsL [Granulosicoccaceae bacterium]|jgi:cell division protein FtsL